MNFQKEPSYSIVMFAYNEADNISTSITSVFDAVDAGLSRFIVIANGCSDNTADVIARCKDDLKFKKLEVIELAIGDKCNAWNHYVHEVASTDDDCHFFVDADVSFSKHCFPKLAEKLYAVEPTPNAIAGLPLSGRNVHYYQSLVRERSCFFGNLYGLSKKYLAMIREQRFRLPRGLNWIDSFLTKAANTDIGFGAQNLPGRVTFLEDNGFFVDSLSPLRLSDISLYKNRIARYELGKIQEFYLDALPVQDWPENMHKINQDIAKNFKIKSGHLSWLKRVLVARRLHRLINNHHDS